MTYLERRNPTAKLLALLAVFVALTLVFDPFTPALFLGLAFAVGWGLGGIRPHQVLRVLWPFLAAIAGIFLANIFFGRLNAGATPLLSAGPVNVTLPALRTATSLSFRILSFAAFSLVFVKTTGPADLILSLIHQCRLHYRLAYGILVGYRTLPLLQGEYETIRAAHRVRGVREREGRFSLWGRVRRDALPLLSGAVRRANRVALAMDARGFGAFPERTYRRQMKVTWADWAFVGVTLAICIGVILALSAAGLADLGVGV
jgi:energy-coupling factor transport system permease protein